MVKERSGPIFVIIAFFILLFIFAKWGPALPFSVLSQSKGEPMVVSAEGKSIQIPDIATINAGVEESGTNLKQVQNSANQKSKTLTDALKKLGVEERDIKTTGYNVYPQSDYSVNPPKITGYRVSIDYQITVRNIDKVNDILSAITPAGANLIGGVSFGLSDKTKKEAMDSARKDAVAKAKENAESLAKASGITLGRIINVSENTFSNIRPLALPMSGGGGVSDKAIIQPEVQPGTTEVNITVSLSYEIR